MKKGDIIEIVTHDFGRLSIRRVRVERATKTGGGCDCGDCSDTGHQYSVRAGNLQGKYVRAYILPAEPITNIRDPQYQNCVNWTIPNDLDETADP